jgi:hypothetical protein
MKEKISFCCILAITFLTLMNGCASTDFTYVWMDETYQGVPLKNVLVIGIIKPYTLKKSFEDQLVQHLKDKGIKGVAGYTVFADKNKSTSEEIAKKIKELGTDSVLITTLIDVSEEEAFVPYANYGNEVGICTYFDRYCPIVALSGQNVQFETKIVKSDTFQLIWSTLSTIELIGYPEDMTKSFVEAIVKELSSAELI